MEEKEEAADLVTEEVVEIAAIEEAEETEEVEEEEGKNDNRPQTFVNRNQKRVLKKLEKFIAVAVNKQINENYVTAKKIEA
jgi:hypothetical protein